MMTALLLEKFDRRRDGPRLLVGARGQEGIEDVGDRYDSGDAGNGFTVQTVRIAAAVPAFMVSQGDHPRGLHQLGRMIADYLRPDHRMLFHDLPFFLRELAGLEQDSIGYPELADVVHRRGLQNQIAFGLTHALT